MRGLPTEALPTENVEFWSDPSSLKRLRQSDSSVSERKGFRHRNCKTQKGFGFLRMSLGQSLFEGSSLFFFIGSVCRLENL